MSFTEYRETVDYTWVVARQLDRVAEAMSRVDPSKPGLGVRRLYQAVYALYALTQPFVGEGAARLIREAGGLIGAGRPLAAQARLVEALGLILGELDRRKLLIRRKEFLGVVEE